MHPSVEQLTKGWDAMTIGDRTPHATVDERRKVMFGLTRQLVIAACLAVVALILVLYIVT